MDGGHVAQVYLRRCLDQRQSTPEYAPSLRNRRPSRESMEE